MTQFVCRRFLVLTFSYQHLLDFHVLSHFVNHSSATGFNWFIEVESRFNTTWRFNQTFLDRHNRCFTCFAFFFFIRIIRIVAGFFFASKQVTNHFVVLIRDFVALQVLVNIFVDLWRNHDDVKGIWCLCSSFTLNVASIRLWRIPSHDKITLWQVIALLEDRGAD